jgi:superfamily II DNA or RNA helicase
VESAESPEAPGPLMILRCGNVWAEVEFQGSGEEAWLGRYLSVPVAGREHSPAYQRRVWDGMQHLLKDDRFPVGLTRLVRAAGAKEIPPVEVVVQDTRGAAPPCAWSEEGLGWLRDYQLDAARAGARRTRGIVNASTGAGKSEIVVAWAVGFRALRWLVLVDTIDLVEQMAARFEKRTGERAGRVGGGQHRVERFSVATFQSMYQGLESGDSQICHLAEDVQGLVGDEIEVIGAKTYLSVAMRCGAYYRFGVSATPLMREDGRDFMTIGATGPVVYKISRQELVARGVLAESKITFVKHHCAKLEDGAGFTEAYSALVVESNERNDLVVEMARVTPRPMMVFVRRRAHGHVLARRLRDAGLRAEFVWGETDAASRRAACERLQRRDIDALVTSKIFNRGVDVPLVAGGINAGAGKGESDALQKVGRLMRVSGTKTSFVFFDVLDRGNRWLRAHATARMRAYEDDGHTVEKITRDSLGLWNGRAGVAG